MTKVPGVADNLGVRSRFTRAVGSPRRLRRWFLLLVAIAAAGLGTAVLLLVLRARTEAHQLVTNPMETRHLPGRQPIDYGMVYDEVSVTTTDGLKLAGWYVPTRNGAVIIAQHGYKSDRGEMLNEAAVLHGHGFGVLISSFRAHDLSDGDLITFGKGEMLDLDAWFRLVLTEPGVDASRIGMLGNSLGGTMAIEFAAQTPGISAVAANSAFSSLADTVGTSVRFFTGLPPFPFVPLITFWAEREAGIRVRDVDATRWIGRLSPRPVMLMQGGADVVISAASGRRLYDAAGEPRDLWFEPNVGHAGFDSALPDEYDRRVSGFFSRYLLSGRVAPPPVP